MSERDVKTEKTDHLDAGPMPSYDDETKPICMKCESLVWVVAVGNDRQWRWKCTNCQGDL